MNAKCPSCGNAIQSVNLERGPLGNSVIGPLVSRVCRPLLRAARCWVCYRTRIQLLRRLSTFSKNKVTVTAQNRDRRQDLTVG
jgi:hypothetical protein